MSAAPQPSLFVSKVERRYPQGEGFLEVLRGADLAIWPGEIVALVAPSGTGKSTLLHVAGLLEKPDGGEVYIGGEPTAAMDDSGRTTLRREAIGFVYQFHHLLPEFSAVENVAMPGWIGRMDRDEALERATRLLTELGLGHRTRHFPNQMSGGEQQRVAIARDLLADPVLFLADEPTGNLDLETSERVFDLMRECHNKRGLTSVIVTHNPDLAARCDRVFEMKSSRSN